MKMKVKGAVHKHEMMYQIFPKMPVFSRRTSYHYLFLKDNHSALCSYICKCNSYNLKSISIGTVTDGLEPVGVDFSNNTKLGSCLSKLTGHLCHS
jgi:hypothetical protein